MTVRELFLVLVFGAVIWILGTTAPAWLVLSLAMLGWIFTACGTWALAERLRCARRERANEAARGLRHRRA